MERMEIIDNKNEEETHKLYFLNMNIEGFLVLLKLVLQALPIYLCSTLMDPKSIL